MIEISASLNQGLDLAQGEFIARMDADNVMLGNRLEEQISFLNKHKEFALVGGWYQVVDEQGKNLEFLRTHCEKDFLHLALKFRNQFAHSAVTMRSKLACKLRYGVGFSVCEDHDLWIRFFEVYKIANLPNTYLSYRWYEKNSCNQNQNKLRGSVLQILLGNSDTETSEFRGRMTILRARLILVYFFINQIFTINCKVRFYMIPISVFQWSPAPKSPAAAAVKISIVRATPNFNYNIDS